MALNSSLSCSLWWFKNQIKNIFPWPPAMLLFIRSSALTKLLVENLARSGRSNYFDCKQVADVKVESWHRPIKSGLTLRSRRSGAIKQDINIKYIMSSWRPLSHPRSNQSVYPWKSIVHLRVLLGRCSYVVGVVKAMVTRARHGTTHESASNAGRASYPFMSHQLKRGRDE